jgi:hypothetical protein
MNQSNSELQKLDRIRKILSQIRSHTDKIVKGSVSVGQHDNGGTVRPFDDETLHKKIERFREQNYLWMVRLQELAEEAAEALRALE